MIPLLNGKLTICGEEYKAKYVGGIISFRSDKFIPEESVGALYTDSIANLFSYEVTGIPVKTIDENVYVIKVDELIKKDDGAHRMPRMKKQMHCFVRHEDALYEGLVLDSSISGLRILTETPIKSKYVKVEINIGGKLYCLDTVKIREEAVKEDDISGYASGFRFTKFDSKFTNLMTREFLKAIQLEM